MDTLGLDIQQSVISCFNDFAMHASCSDVPTIPSMNSSLHQPTWMDSSSSARSSAKKMVGVEARNRTSPGNSDEQHRTARNMTGSLLVHMLSTLFSCIFRKIYLIVLFGLGRFENSCFWMLAVCCVLANLKRSIFRYLYVLTTPSLIYVYYSVYI